MKLMRLAIEADRCQLVSAFTSSQDFLEECLRLYHYDQTRYPMYFSESHQSIQLLGLQPAILKSEDTTGVIFSMMFRFLKRNEDLPSMPHMADMKSLAMISAPLVEALKKFEHEALTLSYFNMNCRDVENWHSYAPAVGRILSYIHLQHYLRYLRANMVTGIGGIGYFDRLTSKFPLLDIPCIEFILKSIDLDVAKLFSRELGRFLAPDDLHAIFVEKLRTLLQCAYYMAISAADSSDIVGHSSHRQMVIHNIAQLTVPRHGRKSRVVYLEEAVIAIEKILCAARQNRRSGDILSMVESHSLTDTGSQRILLLTAANRETSIVASVLAERRGNGLTRIPLGDHSALLLRPASGYDVYLVQSPAMGTIGPSGMTLTAIDVIDKIRPDCVVLTGIACGMRRKEDKQRIGDVLIATGVIPYEARKETETVTIPRGGRPEASTRLVDRFRSARLDWQGCATHYGFFLSGNLLANKKKLVDDLRALAPEAIGLEMEGAGLYAAAQKRNKEWIIVKGISDWGHKKSDRWQSRAATTAAEFIRHSLEVHTRL